MSDFRQLSPAVSASPQITVADVGEAAARGFAMIVNNRPEGEAPDQTPAAEIAAAAEAAGLAYREIPISHAGFSEAQVVAMAEALEEAAGPVLAYCRSGTRSTLLWALAEARAGTDPEGLAASAAHAGYDLGPIRPTLDAFAAAARG
ncbi:hypothetical protein AEB_P0712 [Altererythrobacter sp. B11]|uniref:TIGR01244 family sulfur transferase n=1 Tax=Altererythrobacter sp. B11 TaxID=2060312 RepID=UPI000DC70F48|nr:TIGR01244 family sulfur transferase [Altererythrobacter sp. B11]BBC71580.1 hypothetical protein AEB_P0712 [Altererythrobacter sp. B11]